MSRRRNRWSQSRQSNGWHHGGIVHWTDEKEKVAYLSVVFSWNLPQAYSVAVFYREQGYKVKAGGPAVILNPGELEEVAEVGGDLPDTVGRHNPNATFTSRGCARACPFCAVPKIEGRVVELDDWPVRPIVCDNNLLACSKVHFDRVVDALKGVEGVDFNQGLDSRLMRQYHAQRLAELDLRCTRLAWDNVSYERHFREAFHLLTKEGISPGRIWVYVLIGFKDTPEDALYRLETVAAMGGLTYPMRYQPLDSRQKNGYVGDGWTTQELRRYCEYWSNTRYLSRVPFAHYRRGSSGRNGEDIRMMSRGEPVLPGMDL